VLPIFITLNTILLISSVVKFILVNLNLEWFFKLDENTIKLLNDNKMYMWNPDQRLELKIEGFSELANAAVLMFNYLVFILIIPVIRRVSSY